LLELVEVAVAGYLLFAFAAGAMLPLQFGINAQLASWIESPVRAAFVSFLVGAVALSLVTLAFARGLPGSDRVGQAPWWIWLGGLLGAFYVLGTWWPLPGSALPLSLPPSWPDRR